MIHRVCVLPGGGRAALPALLVSIVLMLGACASGTPGRVATGSSTSAPETTTARPGGYYLDDGPGHLSPEAAAGIPDAVPRDEPVLARTSRPYTVFGRTYTPMTAVAPYRERGVASWYGRRYHGRLTSSGEPYDMYAMTAAHPTLPIPSYVRVTRVDTGQSIVVRINDRGPFLRDRLIDLSWSGAARLGFVERGSAQVTVEAITAFGAAPVQPVEAVGGAAEGVADTGPSAPAAVRDVAAPEDPGGFWLQFGAYASVQRAGIELERLRGELPWLQTQLGVHAEGVLHKVQAGPWPGRGDALEVARRIRAEAVVEPYVVFREGAPVLADRAR